MKRINQDFCKGKISELVLNNIELVTVCGFCYGIFGLYSGRLRLLMLLGVFCFQCYCLVLVSRLSRVLNLQFWLQSNNVGNILLSVSFGLFLSFRFPVIIYFLFYFGSSFAPVLLCLVVLPLSHCHQFQLFLITYFLSPAHFT